MNSNEHALARAQWQPVLFAERPSRLELLKLKPGWPLASCNIRVHRNHASEHMAAAAEAWFNWAGRTAKFLHSDYDDSLSFAFDDQEKAQLEIVWLDLGRYAGRFDSSALVDWLKSRLIALRARTNAPILLVALDASDEQHNALQKASKELPGVRWADLRPINALLGSKFYDERAARFSGTRLSDQASVLVARELACRWAPAAILPRIKAVAIDLDHTLFEGVLGEDGDQVRLTPAHAELHRHFLSLREQGIFLALVSRNEAADVRELFEARKDFPLRWEHFSATAISWGSKADGLRAVAKSLRIAEDAVLFVDDNPGELMTVTMELPQVRTVHALPDANATRRALEYFPGLWAWERSATDAIRAADLEAETERARLAAQSMDPMEYLRCLEVKLRIVITPHEHLGRLQELSQKTNQFNLNLERLSEVDFSQRLDSPEHRVAIIALSDKLSDSGFIGLVVARRDQNVLTIEELTISCRALGRRLEDLMIGEAIRAIREELPAARIQALHRTAPRNGPAREWLAKFAAQTLPAEGCVDITTAVEQVSKDSYPVALEITHHESLRN
ncbi:MAG: HAD-IIIC family phosphatase [Verrucomicrobiota bacterium]